MSDVFHIVVFIIFTFIFHFLFCYCLIFIFPFFRSRSNDLVTGGEVVVVHVTGDRSSP